MMRTKMAKNVLGKTCNSSNQPSQCHTDARLYVIMHGTQKQFQLFRALEMNLVPIPNEYIEFEIIFAADTGRSIVFKMRKQNGLWDYCLEISRAGEEFIRRFMCVGGIQYTNREFYWCLLALIQFNSTEDSYSMVATKGGSRYNSEASNLTERGSI